MTTPDQEHLVTSRIRSISTPSITPEPATGPGRGGVEWGRLDERPHGAELLEIAHAIIAARTTGPVPVCARLGGTGGWLDRGHAGAAVPVGADPEALLRAFALGHTAPPEGSGRGVVLVGPGVDGTVRAATAEEGRMVAAVDGPRPYAEVVLDAADRRMVERLVQEGVLTHRHGAVPHPALWRDPASRQWDPPS